MNLAEKAYTAGIVDGEGTITLTRGHRNETHSPELSVASTSLNLLVWLKEKVGGGLIMKKQKRSDRHSTAYTWKVRDNKAIGLMKELESFLIIKKPHAELIIKNYTRLTPRNGKYSEQMLEEKMRLVAEIKRLNSR